MSQTILNFLFSNVDFNKLGSIKQIVEILTMQKQSIQDDVLKHNYINLRGGGTTQTKCKEQQQQIDQEKPIILELDIFQYLSFYSCLIVRISENEIDYVEINQLNKILQLFHENEANLYYLSNQNELNEIQIMLIGKAIESISIFSRRIKKPKRLLSYNLLKCIHQLFIIIYSQVRIHNSIKFNTQFFHQFKENQKNEAFQKNKKQQQGFYEIYDYYYSLIQIVIKYLEELNAKKQKEKEEQFIFEYNKFQEQSDIIYKLIENAKSYFDDSMNQSDIHQYDIYYFFQSLKLTIIRIIKNNQDISIDKIVNQLCDGYQFSIEKNQNMKVHLHFLEMLFDLISYDQGSQDKFVDQTTVLFNELQSKLLKLDLWKHYIKTQCDQLIKQFVKFNCIKIINTSENQKLQLDCQMYIDLLENKDNNLFILKQKEFQITQENFNNLIDEKVCKKNINKLYSKKLMDHKELILQEYRHEQELNDDQNCNQVNIPLKIKKGDIINDLFEEFDFNCNVQIQQRGEINKFLWDNTNKNDVLLIKGLAGAGKSTILKRLQFFLWNLYDSKSKLKKWIPIYVQLSIIEKPDNNIWSQILESDLFLFNKDEIQSLQQDALKGQENIILLLDGYDELQQKYREKNLILSNQLFKTQLGKNIKIIFTSRIETLNYEKYTQLFIGTNEKAFTQAEIISFDESQIEQYLEYYFIQVFRQKLFNASDNFIQNSQKQNSIISINNFKEIWENFFLEDIQNLLKCLKQSQPNIIISDEFLSSLFYKLQTILECENISLEDQQEFKDDLKKIKSPSEIMKLVKNNQIQNLIQTPQSLKIILSVLLNIDKSSINKKTRKDRFRSILYKLKKQQIKSNNLGKEINDNEYVDNLMNILENFNFLDDFPVEHLNNQMPSISIQDKELIKKAVELSKFTFYQFYKLYVAQYHEKQISKLENLQSDFLRELNKFQMQFAVIMSSSGQSNFQQKQLKKEGKTGFKFQYDYFNDNQDFLKCALIKLKNGCYSFQHKQIQEYFVGKYILRFIKDFQRSFQKRSFEENIQTSLFNQYNFNLSLSNFYGELNIIKDDLQNYDNIKETLIKILKLSTNKNFRRAASNSIFMINYLGMELVGEDLRQIQLENTSISGLNFFGSNLDESKFEEVLIFNCNFNNTSLQQVEWTQIPQEHIEVLNSKNGEIIKRIIVSPNNKILVSWGQNNVYIWNLLTKKIEKLLHNLDLKDCIFSSDSSKILLFSKDFIQIYLIDENDIKLLMFVPYQCNYLFNFYNNCDKVISLNYQYDFFQVLDLRNQIEQKTEWFKQIIVDKKEIPFTTFKLQWNGEVLLGTRDGTIFQWDVINKSIKPLFQNAHKNQIISIQDSYLLLSIRYEEILRNSKIDSSEFIAKNEFIKTFGDNLEKNFIISTSEEQVNIWYKIDEQYKKIYSLPSLKVNGQLPRYFIQNKNDLILIKKDHIIFYDKQQITNLKEDRIFIDYNCLAEVKMKPEDCPLITQSVFNRHFHPDGELFYFELDMIVIAKNNCIEFYDAIENQKMIDRILLDNFQPLSIQFCLSKCIITSNQDETIRFWYMEIEEIDSSIKIKIHPIGFIKGFVKNLKQALQIVDNKHSILNIAIQTKYNQIDIQNIQIYKDQILSNLIFKINCANDSEIGCYQLLNDGTKICITINKIIQFGIFENQELKLIKFQEIHKEKIIQISLSTNEQYLVSFSVDNIIIWDVKNEQAIYFIKDQNCVDILFISNCQFILWTQKSIIFYEINTENHNNILTIIRYLELEQNIDNQNLQYIMSIFKSNFEQYLVIKCGQNIIMKNFIQGDQTKVYNQFELSLEEVVFINKDFLIQQTTQNSLKIINLTNMKEQKEIKYNVFTIQEQFDYSIIAIETMNQTIQIFQLKKLNEKINLKPFNQEIETQDNQTKLAISQNGYYLAYSNKYQINIYSIYNLQLQIVKLSTINIDFQVEKIELSSTEEICIQSQDGLIFYNNFKGHKIKNNINQEEQISDNSYLRKQFKSLKLNYNNKLLALQSKNMVDFQDLSEIDPKNSYKGYLKADLFSISIDNKNFAIYNGIRIEYYDFDLKNNLTPLSIFEIENKQNLLNITFVNDPNSILIISSDNIQFWNHVSKKKEQSIEGIYDVNTQILTNTEVAIIEKSKVLIKKNNKITDLKYQILLNKDDYGFQAQKPNFTQDGQYLIYQKNNDQLIFQSLQDPKLKYTHKILDNQFFVHFFPKSNELLFVKENRREILGNYYYMNIWDISILDNIKLILEIPILDIEAKCRFIKQFLITKSSNNIFCIQKIQGCINDYYDKKLEIGEGICGICPNETKYYKVHYNHISIWNLKERIKLEDFMGHIGRVIAINFTQDEKYMVSIDESGLIIVWNMLDHENIKINFKYEYGNNCSCHFVKINNSLGISCQIGNDFLIYNLKEFKNYEMFNRITIPQQCQIVKHYVFSQGNKLAILYQTEGESKKTINIFKINTKETIETIHLSKFQMFICSLNSEEYFIKDIEKQYIAYGMTLDTNHFWMYNKDLNFLEIHSFNSQSDSLPIQKFFIFLQQFYIKISFPSPKIVSTALIDVGNKYLTYYYDRQFRIIDLELYKQQVQAFALDKSFDLISCLSEEIFILQEVNTRFFYRCLLNKKSDQQQIEILFNTYCDRFIFDFSSDGQYCAQGWDDGDIIILQEQKNQGWIEKDFWKSKQQKKIDHIKFISNNEILISSQDNELSFWNIKKEGILNGRLIQQLKIDFKIQSIVDSLNGYIALSLVGGIIQIITVDHSRCNIENENYEKQFIGCYRSFPLLQKLQTENCITRNSIIQNQDNQSILHLFQNQEISEFEQGLNTDQIEH